MYINKNINSYIPKNINKKMFVMLISCAIFFGVIFGYKLIGKVMMNRYFNNMPLPMPTITTAEVKQGNWILTLESVGTVQAIISVDVTTEAAGVVESIKFQSGDKVENGDILIGLNAKVDQAKLAALTAAMKLAEQNLARAQQLVKAGNIAKAELDLKQSEADQAISQVAVQQELVQQKTIHAPFAGQLGIRKINIGEYIAPGCAIVSLQSLDPIYVNFSIPEQDLYSLKFGLEVDIQVSAFKNEVFKGQITAIEPGADPTTRNFNVQATFENKNLKLHPGMFAEVKIKLPSQEQVVAIPRTAVSYNPYGNSVYVVQQINNNSDKDTKETKEFAVKRRFIKLGRNQGEMVAVVDGLVPGDIVATSGLLKLRNDSKIAINNSVVSSTEVNAK